MDGAGRAGARRRETPHRSDRSDRRAKRRWRRLKLDTNRALNEAHALYRKLGYVEIARYNDNPYADHWFEKRL